MLSMTSLIAALILSAGVAHAGTLQVRDARAAATVPGQPVAAAYMTLSSAIDAEVVSISSDAAGRVELHRMHMHGDIMRMRKIESLALRAGDAVELAPGGLHLMLVDLVRPLEAGQQIRFEFVAVDRRGERTVTSVQVPVVKARPQ